MAKQKTTSLTFRCPDDLLDKLSNFALDNNISKDGKPIITEALIAALSIGLGSNTDVSQDVRQTNNIDIQAIVNTAIASQLADIQEAIKEEYGASFRGITGNFNDALQQRDREIDEINARIEALSSEATVSAKKPLMLSPQLRATALQKMSQAA